MLPGRGARPGAPTFVGRQRHTAASTSLSYPARLTSFPPSHRHSRESGNPPPAITHLVPCHIRRPPPPSFRRRPESGTPVGAGRQLGRGVDSRFRGNDGGENGSIGLERRRKRPKEKLPFRKRGVGGIRPAPPYAPAARCPIPSFRRRSESRTPADAGRQLGRGVDSRFRGNDGGGRGEWPGGWRAGCGGGGGRVYPGWRKQPGLPGFWIPAYAGMTVGGQISPTPNRHLRLYPVIPAKAGIHPPGHHSPCTLPHSPVAPTVIPAQAGIQNSGGRRPAIGPGGGFPLSRE